MRVTLGTRGSALALWQARHVAGRLAAAYPGLDVAISILKTEGDRFADALLTAAGGRGVFVREIEEALLAGAIDLAVHSLKDLPTATPQGVAIAAVLKRADPRDALVSPHAGLVSDLPEGIAIATGSPRRRGQILHARPDVRFVAVRGNVDTRLRKLAEGQFDALVLAAAGLLRLDIDRSRWAPIPTEVCLPAPGQGALAVEIRTEDGETRRLVAALDHPDTAAAVTAERSFLSGIEAGCLAPAAALAVVAGEDLTIEALVASPDGRALVRERSTGSSRDAAAVGLAVAKRILARGGDAIVTSAR